MSKRLELLESIFNGRAEFFRSSAIHSPLEGAECCDIAEGTFYYSSGINYAPCNGIIEEDLEKIPSDDEINRAVEFFKTRGLPFIWWSSAKKLEEREFQFGGALTGIALDLSREIPLNHTSRVNVKTVQSEEDLNRFSELVINSFGMNCLEEYQTVNKTLFEKGELQHFLAYLDETPVGTATLSTGRSSAGIWNLGTLPEYRKQGVGGALVHSAVEEAKRRRYHYVMAILMPEGLAKGLFSKLGFEEVCSFPFYVHS